MEKARKKIFFFVMAAVLVIAAVIAIVWFSGKDKKEIAGLADSTGELSSEENYEKTEAVKETGKDEDTQKPTTETADEDTPETSLETLKKLGNSELSLSIALDDGKYLNFSYGAEGKLSVEINKNCFDWALN